MTVLGSFGSIVGSELSREEASCNSRKLKALMMEPSGGDNKVSQLPAERPGLNPDPACCTFTL